MSVFSKKQTKTSEKRMKSTSTTISLYQQTCIAPQNYLCHKMSPQLRMRELKIKTLNVKKVPHCLYLLLHLKDISKHKIKEKEMMRIYICICICSLHSLVFFLAEYVIDLYNKSEANDKIERR
jgi:hypothetical protein